MRLSLLEWSTSRIAERQALSSAGSRRGKVGCAKDIVEHCGVPRLLLSDSPLGNAAGKLGDVASQRPTLELALRVLESAPGPRTTMQSPLRWSADPAWKRDYCNIDHLAPEVLA